MFLYVPNVLEEFGTKQKMPRIPSATVVLVLALCCISSGTANHVPKMFVLPQDYIKTEIPRHNQSGVKQPHVVKVNIEIYANNGISLQRQDIEVDLTLTIVWSDPRLPINQYNASSSLWSILSKEEIKEIWTPTLIFQNCKGCSPICLANGYDLYANKQDGRILGQIRLLKIFACAIDLRAFPMDIQFCRIQLYTYEATNDVLQLEHTDPDKEVIIGSNVSLAQYYIAPIIKTKCLVTDYDGEDVRIRLDHQIGFHLMTLYAPTSFIVALSWISFWLPLELAPARVALGFTSLLTLATRLDQAQKDLPPVAYVKAIDVWMFACIFLVSMSLCEFAFSHYKWESSKSKSAVTCRKKVRPVTTKLDTVASSGAVHRSICDEQHKNNNGTKLDEISRILFPSTFLFFNIVYWSYYLSYYN